jgi:hypothetical protein
MEREQLRFSIAVLQECSLELVRLACLTKEGQFSHHEATDDERRALAYAAGAIGGAIDVLKRMAG